MDSTTRLLGGRYQVGELIGRGGMAEVHAGHDTRLGRTVAIKVLRADLARDPSFLARFRREAPSAAGLNHPSIVAVYDSGEDEDTESSGRKVALPYIVMEYIEGRTLREILSETKVMEPAEAARVTEGVLDALAYSHRMGIVHRDIKPANVMLTPNGDVKVMDFGIARAIADTAATMTQTQSVIGTAQYLSPEQAQGTPVDARSDLYSAGCLLFELLTGRTPFVGDSPVSVAYQHVGQAPQAPSVFQPGLSSDMDAVVLHALAKDRDARYQDASQFRADLAAARTGAPISSAAHGTAAGAGVGAAALSGDPTMAIGQTIAQTSPTQVVRAPGVPAQGGSGATTSLPPIGTDPTVQPRKRRKATYALLALAVIAALVLIGFAARSMLATGKAVPQLTVPSVTGLTQAEAAARLTSAGFVPKVSKATNAAEKGTVFDENPPANERRPAKSTVTIFVSTGRGQTEVPDVTGFALGSARASIKDAHLSVGRVESVDDPKVDKGKVIETVPKARSSVPANSAVVIRIASGKVKVPDVVGNGSGDAQKRLTDARLKYKTRFEFSAKPEGTVLSQTHGGETVDLGTQIDLVVAQAAPPTAPPTTQPPAPPTTQPPATTTPPTAPPTTGGATTAP
ncbi:MAG: eukaryotic-like serine/threonine-protein kinase [Actinomycetota bacterium]|nr:eukaryotic-like serine/threonine-protein kinase [Actinomycetota bacterium]